MRLERKIKKLNEELSQIGTLSKVVDIASVLNRYQVKDSQSEIMNITLTQ